MWKVPDADPYCVNLDKRLKKIGVKKIAIVDDSERNREAAEDYYNYIIAGEVDIELKFFENSADVINEIKDRNSFDLIFSDMDMEVKDSGLEVAYVGWSYGIPVVICSGGYEHANQPIVKIYPGFISTGEGVEKDSSEFWQKILEGITGNIKENKEGKMLEAAFYCRNLRESFNKPSHCLGMLVSSAVALDFNLKFDEKFYAEKYGFEI